MLTKKIKRPIRILHVVGSMNRGGIETWLMHILRRMDRDRFQMDFLVHTTDPCAYNEEIRAKGSLIIPCLDPSRPWMYASNFKHILREYGSYDIVHSHVHHFTGYVLRLAQQAGVPVRIAHSHLDSSSIEARARFFRRLYLALTKYWIGRYATDGLGCSRNAVVDLFTKDWEINPRCRTLYCGIDLTPFQEHVDSVAVRAELGIPPGAFVIGHVGRFAEQKNHEFLADIAAFVAKRQDNMYLLLVGEGSLRPNIEQKVADIGLGDRVIFAGSRPDVPRLMLGAMDVFVFPSLYEGLSLVLVEAQVAGLPCILSDVLTEEADLVKPLIRRISLSQPASIWGEAILTTRKTQVEITQSEAFMQVEKSLFNIQISCKELEKLYLEKFRYALENKF